MNAAIRWERSLLRIAFRLRPIATDTGRMGYNMRTARKIDDRMAHFKYKQIHIAILERLFIHIWHERTVAQQMAAVRRDRDLDIWEAVKDALSSKRKLEEFLHGRQGPQLQFSTLFGKVWGVDWWTRLDNCVDFSAWKSQQKPFVMEACRILRLPKPPEWYNRQSDRGGGKGRGLQCTANAAHFEARSIMESSAKQAATRIRC